MGVLKRSTKPTIILFLLLILTLFILDIHTDYESEVLLLALNTVFLGLMPITVSVLSARTYIRNGLGTAMLMSCGMLVFGLGCIIAACARFLPDSANYTATTHNLSVCLCAMLNLAASIADKQQNNCSPPKTRFLKLIASYFGVCLFLFAVIASSIMGIIPVFYGAQGSTEIRNIILCIAMSMCLGASIAFYKQYKQQGREYLYWYSCSLLLISMGLLAISFSKIVGSPVTWMGRVCQYIGCCYALISMAEVVKQAKMKGVPASKVMTEFFIDAESNYKILVENLSSAVININEDSRVFFCNSAAKNLFKYTDNDFLNASFIDSMISVPYRKQLHDDSEAFIASGKSELAGKSLFMEAIDGQGRVFPVELSFSISILSTGYARSFIVHDISERVKQEEMLTLQAEELQKKNKLITEFFTNVSHEFRTPLTIILNAIELTEIKLSNSGLEHKDRVMKNLSVMRQNSHRLLRLIANLLDVNKIDAGYLQVNLTNISIKEWMRKLVDSVIDFAAKREIDVTLVDELEILSMPLDGEILDRIMLNLLSNAIKHTGKGGHIIVTMRESIDRITICVADDGEGIPDDKKDLVFDRFRQINTSMTRTSEGSGIGLALTKSLVELLHGSIWFESAFGEGARFYVELPILEKTKRTAKLIMQGLKLSRKVEMEFSDII